MLSRRGFLNALIAAGVGASARPLLSAPFRTIDRFALVTRHNPRLRKIDPLSPLSVGNGEFAFTADVTGLQTLPQIYAGTMPLCTMSQWGWHTRPLPTSLKSETLRPKLYETYGRKVGYYTSSENQTELYNWLRENPHRLHLGQIALCFTNEKDRTVDPQHISEIDQQLDLWRGLSIDRDDCSAIGRNKNRRRRPDDDDRKESLFAQRAQLAATEPAVLSPGQRRFTLRDRDDGRRLEGWTKEKRAGLSGRRKLDS